MKPYKVIALAALIGLTSCKKDVKPEITTEDTKTTEIEAPRKTPLEIVPIEHATLSIEFGEDIIYIDPVGDFKAKNLNMSPSYILITDIHPDHLSLKTLESFNLKGTKIIAPEAVKEQLSKQLASQTIVLKNGEIQETKNFSVEAVPMYNLREEALQYHPKGRGNGYILTLGDQRIYISGDTEDIPEMRALKNIDKAFICMNLPYTMTVKSAADAVLEFAPTEVYPYHYRGTEGLSDVNLFKTIVLENNRGIEVIQWDWYKSNE
ncbi:MBL fold metallo-hydrolase [Bizionia paragorgiae]|jgi:L-ascorbate metabolism protein UlaG (beta-lactamase superfamily)|uniref:L-ascorbate metabolism protein UlaG, beta-lactamase superfamily n=1 Tax=Bizionia paragorgiae TaxID=283786 RepID=A0A1H3X9R8_BIZPA|nr:MBL fold metallo-hydrolase [Bizionia paragorgiae]SDZ95308.1 L-ascorbate metabolism protein UlaG, beta-lactamase superfamily [Bizionia paragorgiae]